MSRYYTNVHIPEQFGSLERLQNDLKIKELHLKIALEKADYLLQILENIPNAIAEFGYVDLTYDNGKKEMKIGQVP